MEIVQYFFPSGGDGVVARVVNLIVLAIGLRGAFGLFRAWQALARDRTSLTSFAADTASVTASNPESFGDLASRPPLELPTPSAVLESRAAGLPRETILQLRMEALTQIRRAGDAVDAASLSAQASARLERQGAYAKWATGGVVLLGLAGTLVGLSIAVSGAQGLVSEAVQGDAEVLQELTTTFKGLTTAFSTTLWGIVFAILLGLGLARLRHDQTKYLEALESFSLTQLYPFYRTNPAVALAQSAQHLSRIEAGLEEALREVVTTMHSTGAALVETTTEKLLGLTSTVDRSFSALREELAEQSVNLLRSYQQTHSVLHALAGDPTANGVTLASVATRLDHAGAEFVKLSAGITQSVPSIEEAIARQVDRQSRDLHETMHTYVERHSANLQEQNEIVRAGLAALETRLPAFERLVAEALAGHERALTTSLGTAVSQLTTTMEHANQASQAFQKSAGVLEGTTDRIEVVLQRAVEASGRAAGGTDRIVTAIHELRQSLAAGKVTSMPGGVGPLTERVLPPEPRPVSPSTDRGTPQPAPDSTVQPPGGLLSNLRRMLG